MISVKTGGAGGVVISIDGNNVIGGTGGSEGGGGGGGGNSPLTLPMEDENIRLLKKGNIFYKLILTKKFVA